MILSLFTNIVFELFFFILISTFNLFNILLFKNPNTILLITLILIRNSFF